MDHEVVDGVVRKKTTEQLKKPLKTVSDYLNNKNMVRRFTIIDD